MAARKILLEEAHRLGLLKAAAATNDGDALPKPRVTAGQNGRPKSQRRSAPRVRLTGNDRRAAAATARHQSRLAAAATAAAAAKERQRLPQHARAVEMTRVGGSNGYSPSGLPLLSGRRSTDSGHGGGQFDQVPLQKPQFDFSTISSDDDSE